MTDRIAIRGARVFDGHQLSEPRTVVIADGVIGTDPTGAEVVEADGRVLLPGLIDAHIHLHDQFTVQKLCSYGVTTALDMGTFPPQRLATLRGAPGPIDGRSGGTTDVRSAGTTGARSTATTDVRSAGTPAIGPDGLHSRIPTMPADAVVTRPDQAESFVMARLAEGSDYLKIIADPGEGGPDQQTVIALATAAHAHGMRVVVHAVSQEAVIMALDADADVITHVPLGMALDQQVVARLAAADCTVIPTLTMMEGIAGAVGQPAGFAASRLSVTLLHQAGVRVLAGTDTNQTPGVPFQPAPGASLHHELELLVDAGLTPADALQAATHLAAQTFGLTDRGTIKPGLRADLILLDDNPLTNIRATRSIHRIWTAGTEHPPPTQIHTAH
ncbi:amidohydrolase family protein [Kribbella catacumbae]|uniref:amidohydrolase family protein n=1 Tax=Kribbella catacumbae TaxID=460086 RepID=UPI0003822B1E|nr:amidohydrolase family protein [Kribbella catacumbae]